MTYDVYAGRSTLSRYTCVLHALIMHDIKTRFFGNGLGQVVMILWPFFHVVILLLLYTVLGRIAPYGDSLVVYSSIGLIPFIIFSYMSRWVMFSTLQNRAFLQYPAVRLLDIILARALLEAMSAFIMTAMLLLVLFLMGENPTPLDWSEAASAWVASVALAFGLGVFNAAVATLFPLWNICFTLIIIVTYAASGILYVTSTLPSFVRNILSWNPVLQTVEWMRTAYYINYNSLVLDRMYVLEFTFFSLALGLVLLHFTFKFKAD